MCLNVFMRGDDQPLLEAGVSFGGKEIVHGADAFNVGGLEIIFGVFEFLLTADLAIGHACAVLFVPDGVRVVERDQDAFEPVGDLNRDGVECHAAHLLEVGELRDLLPVEPDLPPETPGGDGGLFPVVLHKADVVLARVDAERLERLEIQFLRVARVGLEDYLKLGVLLEAVGVLAVTPVIGAHRRLDVRHVPRFGSEHAQEGGRVHRPCTDLGVVGLGNQASVRCPEVLEFEDDFLERGWHSYHFSIISCELRDEIIPDEERRKRKEERKKTNAFGNGIRLFSLLDLRER